MQTQQDFVLVDDLQVGLDRAKITKSGKIELSEHHERDNEETNGHNKAGGQSLQTSSHHTVETIKAKKHRAGLRIRKALHVGKLSNEPEDTTPALVGSGVGGSGSRYMTDAPEPDKPTVNDFLHNPVDTVKSKISDRTNQQIAQQITAKEVPHGDEVDLIHASESVEHAQDETQRLQAMKDVSKLKKKRQPTYARWTLDRHVTRIRRLPKDDVALRPRSDFKKQDVSGALVTDWRAYGQNLLVYYAHLYGGQYIGYGSDPPTPSKETILPNIERVLLASSPFQELIMKSRRIYRWEQPMMTASYLLLYSVLWYFEMLLPGFLVACVYVVVERRAHGNSMQDLLEDIKHREDQNATALSISEMIVKEGDQDWSDKLVEDLGPWLMIQLADLANFLESLRSFYEWRDPYRTLYVLVVLSLASISTTLIPTRLLAKILTFAIGVTYFALYPLAVNFPEYRLLVSPAKRFLWNIPTHAEWAIRFVQAEGTQVARESVPIKSEVFSASPTFDRDYDYNSYPARNNKTSGRLILGGIGLRFVSDIGHDVMWNIEYAALERIEKVDRVVTRSIQGKLQRDSGQDLQIMCRHGESYLLRSVINRNEAFSQVVGLSNVIWQVIW